MVSMAIFALVLASLSGLIRHTVRFYTIQVRATEVQQQALQATRWLSQELQEGSYQSIDNRTAPSSAVIFGSPRDEDDHLNFSGNVMLWQKLVCYYVDKVEGKPVLKRGVLQFESPAHAPPPIPTSMTSATFQGTDAPQRLMARDIDSVQVTVADSAEIVIQASVEDGAFVLKLKTRVEMGN